MKPGLYQYIREQEHRKDPVGALGRWMSKNYNRRPDSTTLAFQLASAEFEASANWTRKAALDRLNQNKDLMHIIKVEKDLSGVIKDALNVRACTGYNKEKEYCRLKSAAGVVVGYGAANERISDSQYYLLVIRAIYDLLPPDISILYPNGFPDEISLDL